MANTTELWFADFRLAVRDERLWLGRAASAHEKISSVHL